MAFSFGLTWLIATVIQKTIGLRVPAADELKLDQDQQGLEAYHLDPVTSLPGAASPTARAAAPQAGPTAPAEPPKLTHSRLVTGLLDPELVDSGELRNALLSVGAVSIVVAEAHVSAGTPVPQVVRGYRRNLELVGRLRVDVLVAERDVPAILAVFDRFSPDRVEGFVQPAEPSAALRSRPGESP